MNHTLVASNVLNLEIKGLQFLIDNLGDEFSQAVDLILKSKGRVIITGIGKSGHVGAKIAATMSSTGTSASFIHSSEASHGDLGMVSAKDVVIFLSNSGETTELSNFLEYTRRQNIPSIAITKSKKSTLGKATNIVICLPDVKEACSLGLAPTTSTIATMAIGDALSIALLEAKKFSIEDFKKYHPGGKLGKKLLFVKDVMKYGNNLSIVETGTSVIDALSVMEENRLGCVGVISNNELVGIFTDGDLLRYLKNNKFLNFDLSSKIIDDIMIKNPVVVTKNQLVGEVLKILEEKKISVVFVVKEKRPIGLLHFNTLL